jgi:hypothetical protein
MKKILIILLFVPVITWGRIFYIAPADSGGNDAAAGTIGAPWATLQKAIIEAYPGDTMYFRGGVYWMTTGANIMTKWIYQQSIVGRDGKADSLICYFNYPGERPIFDGTNSVGESGYNFAVAISYAEFLHFRGFTIRNWPQIPADPGPPPMAQGIGGTLNANIIYENITVHDVAGRAFSHISAIGDATAPGVTFRIADNEYYYAYDSTYFINCDAYNCFDNLSDPAGNGADGIKAGQYPGAYIHIEGCRFWNVGDDGIDVNGSGLIYISNSWVFNNGWQGDGTFEGNGMKFGSVQDDFDYPSRIMINNISAHNKEYGYADLLLDGTFSINYFYNNVSWKNGLNIVVNRSTEEGDLNKLGIFRNNISYMPRITLGNMTHWEGSNNTFIRDGSNWLPIPNPAYTVTDADFLVTDSATIINQLMAPRKADGSLPDITAFRLASDSDLKGAGVNVGMSTNPDIGLDFAWLDGAVDSTATDILSFTLPQQTAPGAINFNNHTVAIQVAYGTDVSNLTPTISVSYGATILPPSGTWNNFTTPQTYTVTALDEITTQEWTVTVTVASAPPVDPPTGRRFVRSASGRFTRSIGGQLLYYED